MIGGEMSGWMERAKDRYGRRGQWAPGYELIHEQAGCSEIAGNLEMIHDHDFLNLSLGKNCEDLAQLMLGGYENHGSAGITQSVGGFAPGSMWHRRGR